MSTDFSTRSKLVAWKLLAMASVTLFVGTLLNVLR